MSDDLHKLATEIVASMAVQDRAAAIARIYSALQAAYTDGMTAGMRHTAQMTSQVFDAILGGRH